MKTLACFLVVVLSLQFCSNGILKVGMTGFLKDSYPFLVDFNPDGTCGSSFECELIAEICRQVGQECVVVPLPDLDARLSYLETKQVNFTINVISVNPGRAERVHFVRPYYYYAGAVVFHLSDTPVEEQYSWEDITGKRICMNENYYAAPAIKLTYNPEIVFIAGNNASNLQTGICDAAIADNTAIIPGLTASTNMLPEFGAPYGIAVSQDDTNTLGAAISVVLRNIMGNGTDSLILKFENTHLVEGGGFLPSKKLFDLVTMMTKAGGLISPLIEDAIWDE